MKRKLFVTSLITLATLLLTGFAPGDIRQDMVKLDKVYIAALALTSQGKIAESRKTVGDRKSTRLNSSH